MKEKSTNKVGKVFLVGAGPGAPGLITLKGAQCLKEAQVVVYDRLVNPSLLAQAPPAAERIYVGKSSGGHTMTQEEINSFLVAKAREGKDVVRLKGGDPFVFGRGGEEVEALVEAGIPFEMVPGVTSATAVPAYAGIPLTHRKVASSFTVVSGSEDPTKGETALDWAHLAGEQGTLVVLMGWEGLPGIVEALVKSGKDPATPVALVRWGTESRQQTVTGTLATIVERAQETDLAPPVVVVIGEVVRFRERFRWFDTGPLFGKRVLVTRSRSQASALSETLACLGAEPVELPTIEVQPLEEYTELDAALGGLDTYAWVVFTSVNGVEAVFRRLAAQGGDTRAFGGVRVCAIGPATAEALAQRGISADLMPDEYISEAILEEFKKFDVRGARVLLPRAEAGREVLAEGLVRLGSHVDQVGAYRTVTPTGAEREAQETLQDGNIDVATFTSSSTVRNLVELLNGRVRLLQGVLVACIGSVTAETARQYGLPVHLVAREHTIHGLVQALVEHFERKGVV